MFIFLETDSFDQNSRRSGLYTVGLQRVDEKSAREKIDIRRPYRGVQIKEDTYAVISVRGPDGGAIPLVSSSSTKSKDSGQGKVIGYSDFIIQRLEDQRTEKNQIIETFGDTFVYFFGERPRTITFSGMLMNTEDFNWRAQFWYNYEKYLRGTRLVQLNARVYLAYDTIVIEGYPLSASAVDDAETHPYSIPFQMQMLVTNYHEYSQIGETKFPGIPTENALSVLNDELEKRRRTFVSTTAEVRALNLRSSGGGGVKGFLSAFREGIQGFNSLVGTVGRFLDEAQDLIAGRSVRLPVGVAGYLAATSDAQIGVGSIKTSGDMRLEDTEVGGVKFQSVVRMAGASRFAFPWLSKITGTERGLIHENWDEYPRRDQPQSLEDMRFNTGMALAAKKRRAERIEQAKLQDEKYARINLVANSGGIIGELSDLVSFARDNFSMVMTAASFIGDPLGTTAAALGITPGDIPQMGLHAIRQSVWPIGPFIGTGAGRSFASYFNAARFEASAADLFEHGEAALGQAYSGVAYTGDGQGPTFDELQAQYGRSPGAEPEDIRFEDIYEGQAYSALLAGLTEEERAERKRALAEVYGDVDVATEEDSLDQAALAQVFSLEGGVDDTSLSAEDRAALLAAVYSNVTVSPEEDDTSGIRADYSKAPNRIRYKKDTTRILPAV